MSASLERQRETDKAADRALSSDECCSFDRLKKNSHEEEKKLNLLSHSTGPFCHRVLLAAGEKQVPLTLGYVDFAAKPDW